MNRKKYLKLTKNRLFLALSKSTASHERTIRDIEWALTAETNLPTSVLHHLNHALVSYGRKPIINGKQVDR